jgi:hypothetical protein
MREACIANAGDAGSVSSRINGFSEVEMRKQGLVTVGILVLAGLVTVGGAMWCSADGVRERAAMMRDLEKISNFDSTGQMPSVEQLQKMIRIKTSAGE